MLGQRYQTASQMQGWRTEVLTCRWAKSELATAANQRQTLVGTMAHRAVMYFKTVRILFLQPTYLKQHCHQVILPTLPDNDFAAALARSQGGGRPASAEIRRREFP
jgi:hypothetical protein